jgi:fructokinase
MAEVVCMGEALIDFVAAESGVGVGEASGFVRAPGGAPANVAVGVARLGRTSAFLGKVGDDPFGRFLERTFAGAGVDTGGMVFDPRHRTGLAFVSLKEDGERDFCFFRNPSADRTYRREDLDFARIAGGQIFHFGSITLIDRITRTATRAAIEIARSAGLLISYDPNLRPSLWPDLVTARKGILRAAKYADIVKVSAEELVFLVTDADTFPVEPDPITAVAGYAVRLIGRCPNIELLVVTLGAQGCYWRGWGGRGRLPGWPVSAVDTTGAGDGFVAGMLTGLLEQGVTDRERLRAIQAESLKAIFEKANAVGALTTTQKGAIPALPTAAQVAEFQRNRALGR